MTDFGPSIYGEPCRECGFSWTITAGESASLISNLVSRFRELLGGASGDERAPQATWSVTSYVMHVADNLRIWAERIVGVTSGVTAVIPYDQDELAKVRGYGALPSAVAPWSLERAVGDFETAWALANDGGAALLMVHPVMGLQPLSGVIALVAHDAHHHEWDLRRAV